MSAVPPAPIHAFNVRPGASVVVASAAAPRARGQFVHRRGVRHASACPGGFPRAPRRVLSLGRHAHARRRAQRPSGRARGRCRARGDPGGPPAICLSPRLPTASSGTPTASPEVEGSRPPVIAIGGREFRATGGSAMARRLAPLCHFGRCFCVLPWFCYKQACTIARPKYNSGIAVEKFGQAFFAIYKILWILTSLASTF